LASEKIEHHILNLGAGVQSTALYLMFANGNIKPQIECAIFADTQDEPGAEQRRLGLPYPEGSVYSHLDWLKSLNGPPIWIRSIGQLPHKTPRSACTFCPFRSDLEWDRLRQEDPIGWQRAVTVDYALRIPGNIINRNMDQPMFLHRSCKPLDLVVLDTTPKQPDNQMPMFGPSAFARECLGVCGL